MNVRRRLFRGTAVAVCVALVCFGSPGFSSAQGLGEAITPVYAPTQGADPAEGRETLSEYYSELKSLYPYIAEEAPAGLYEQITEGEKMASQLTPEQLAQMDYVFAKNPQLMEGLKTLNAVYARRQMESRMSMKAADEGPPTVPNGVLDVYIAKTVAQGFEIGTFFVPQDLVEGAVVLGEGVVTTIWAHPAKMILEVGYSAALAAALALEGTYDVRAEWEDNQHASLLETHDEALQDHTAAFTSHDIWVRDMLDDTQFALDHEVAKRQVDLEVVELQEKRSFLISASEGGRPVSDIEFTAVKCAGGSAAGFTDATSRTTVKMVEPGCYRVDIRHDTPVTDLRFFSFEVVHAHDVVDHYGFTLFDRQK